MAALALMALREQQEAQPLPVHFAEDTYQGICRATDSLSLQVLRVSQDVSAVFKIILLYLQWY